MTPPATPADVEDLYRRHATELRAYLYRRAGDDGVDLLGDVFVIALRRCGELPEPRLRRAWLYGTARRLLLAHLRESGRRTLAEEQRVRLAGGTVVESDDNRSRAVHRALASLKDSDRELILLTEWEQLPIVEVAAALGMRPGAARMRLYRARRALAEHPEIQPAMLAER